MSSQVTNVYLFIQTELCNYWGKKIQILEKNKVTVMVKLFSSAGKISKCLIETQRQRATHRGASWILPMWIKSPNFCALNTATA